jgi:hypothetical protein
MSLPAIHARLQIVSECDIRSGHVVWAILLDLSR